MNQQTSIYLASRSPRRRELLTQLGIEHQTLVVDVDEKPLVDEPVDAYVTRLALAKARAGREFLAPQAPQLVLGADTAVLVDCVILGKPNNREEGLKMLQALSGREHRVLSAVAVVSGEREAWRLQISQVRFRRLTPEERQAYWATGEATDKAGAYAVQGRAAAFITELHGSYSGVMGLPLFETCELLREFDIHCF